MNFGSLYYQMGTVPESKYLMEKNTLDNNFAGSSQTDTPKPYKINNNNLYIGQAPLYNPIQSTTSFGNVSKKKMSFNQKKKPKIKLVKSNSEIKQKQSNNKKFDQSIPKIKEGSTISVNGFGKIKVH